MMTREPFALPATIKIGAATASLQIEGGDRNNTWYRYSALGRTKDGVDSLRACDHWNRVDEDIGLMQRMNLACYRLSLEWSRIEPAEGRFDDGAIAHYRTELEKLRAAGIEPIVTLHHFSNPLWMEDSGGWAAPSSVPRFLRYAQRVVRDLGDLVSTWVTINEPNVYMTNGYLFAEWPPEHRSPLEGRAVARNMMSAHRHAYLLIHRHAKEEGRTGTMVGAAHHLRVFEAADRRPSTRLGRRIAERLFQGVFLDGMTTGRNRFPVGSGYPDGRGRASADGSPGGFADFIGINYYTRDMIAGFSRSVRPGSPRNDLGWEIYPEGLYDLCRAAYRTYGRPILVTENGTADRRDAFRSRYIFDHLYQLKRLADDGVDVRAYCHWTLMDNFEWKEGQTARFGLAETDFATEARTLRASGRFYAEIARTHAVTGEMIRTYITPEEGADENGKLQLS